MPPMSFRSTCIILLVSAACTGPSNDTPAPVTGTAYGTSSADSRRFAALADEYLDGWAALYPSIAAGNGLHAHDGNLEDFSAEAMTRQVVWFKAMKARLDSIATDSLTPDERVDRRILAGIVDGWLLDIDTVKNWQRNPMLYASAIADGVHNLMTMESSSAEDRMGRLTSKLRQVPRLLETGRANLVNPPRILVDRGIAMMRGASSQLGVDLDQAFPGPRGEAWNAMHAQASNARDSIDAFVRYLETDVRPKAHGEIALGKRYVEARYRAEELIDVPVETLLTIGERELARQQALFVAKAKQLDSKRDALAVWRDVLGDHPKRGELVAATQRTVDELRDFVVARHLVELPNDERVVVEPSKPYDIGLASMHASPPLEATPVKSIFYVTDADSTWAPGQQEKWLEHFNYPSLAITSAHEAMPGHFVHSLFMRQTPGKVRRIWIGLNPFPQPSSGQDGWAHYAEHLVVEQGFHDDDPRYAMAQLSESMTRICRLIGGIKLHTQGWTVERAAKLFEDEAHVPGPAAMQEATRLVYDPTNGGYFLGKQALLTLRDDYHARVGDKFTLADFHARVMRNGIAPLWAHRQLLLPGDSGAVVR
jgi:uncharacterized protein (DUF885 family)